MGKKTKRKSAQNRQRNVLIIGLFFGITIGALFGYHTDNIVIGLLVGILLGAGMGYAINNTIG